MTQETNSYRILVIEDNPGDYFLLEQYLQLSKLRVEKTFHAENMAAATALVKDNSFDIAMLDLTLPDSTGIDSVKTLNWLLPKTPIIVFSGLSTTEIAIKSISMGAQDYLIKGEFDEKILTKSIQYSTERKRTKEELAEQELKQQKRIIEVAIQAREKEKNELGRELHDNINQILATVKIYLGLVKSGQNLSEDLVGKSYEYVDYTIEEIRKLSHSLVAPSLSEHGLKKVLQELLEDANLFNSLQVHLLVDEKIEDTEIDENKELMIYRIVQEHLNNITKYAQAQEAIITLKSENGNLVLTIADNGVGFDTSQKSKGIGLKNIKSRVDFYSGNMNVISAPGQGCTLEVCISL
jgi:signal transduction histidine kinase